VRLLAKLVYVKYLFRSYVFLHDGSKFSNIVVKWGVHRSKMYKLNAGARQVDTLTAIIHCIVNDMLLKLQFCGFGLHIVVRVVDASCTLILNLISASLTHLQQISNIAVDD